jgi:hypothetical protein
VFLPKIGKNLSARLKQRRAFVKSGAACEPFFRFAIDFVRQDKTYEQFCSILLRGAMPFGSAVKSVFFLSVHFPFCIAIKKESEQ